ncbi:MAG: membrane dipeptidase [Firmicutes bacterium]|nr:membrane dipeptidase [Bacillota bacterium]
MQNEREEKKEMETVKSDVQNMQIVDLHCDTVMLLWRDKNRKLRSNDGHLSLEKMIKGHGMCQFFAAYISRKEMEYMSPYDMFCQMADCYDAEMAANSDLILPAYTKEDILRNKAEGKLSGVLAIEDGVCLEGRIERVQEFYDRGVRLITLLWNFENEIGFPCRDDAQEHSRGLKPFGFQVVEEMNRLGMLVDLSHSSEGVFHDVARVSKAPFLASHSCARALAGHRRNLTDKQLAILGEKGGIVGLNFEETFLNHDGSAFTFDRAVEHCVHIVDKAGIEALALGSDFDGIDNTGEMVDYGNYPMLIDRLNKVFTMDQIDKITHENALRIIGDVMG